MKATKKPVTIKDVKFKGESLEEYHPPIVKVRAEGCWFDSSHPPKI